MQAKLQSCNNKRLLHDIFHIGPGINPRLLYQARQRSWRADMGRGLIPGTIWKISCHNLFITYFTLTFSKHWLLFCKKDLWTEKLRMLKRNFHSNANILGRFYKQFLTSLYRSTLFGIFLKPDSNKNICKLNKGNSLKDLFSQFLCS
jgi:hypothetical protein